jgi:inosose dehydratase
MQINQWKFGISPINWVNEDIHEIGDHYTFEQLMEDFSTLGFTGTENCRKFPQDPAVLKGKLAERGIELTSQWKGVIFADPAIRQEELAAYRKHVEFLHAMGSKRVVTCEIGGSPFADPRETANREAVQPLTDEQWGYVAEGLEQAGAICAEYGMKLVYHYHMGTVVESGQQIDRLMAMTDPGLVHLLFDTGHAYYGGSDPLDILRRHADRIAYVHLKDVREDVLSRVRKDGLTFLESVVNGVFTVPGDGCIDFAPIFGELRNLGYEGWMILEAEQDPSKAEPNHYARIAIDYIGRIARA